MTQKLVTIELFVRFLSYVKTKLTTTMKLNKYVSIQKATDLGSGLNCGNNLIHFGKYEYVSDHTEQIIGGFRFNLWHIVTMLKTLYKNI